MKARSWSWSFLSSRARGRASALVCALSMGVAGTGAVGCGGGGVAVQSPIAVQSGRTVEQTEQAILEVLPRRGWTAESVQPGRVVAFLSIRKHLLRVDIRYDAQRVNLFYVNSDNLAAHVEANGQVYAHRNVNRWIQLLARDIASELALAPQTGAGGVGAAPALPPAAGMAPQQPAPSAPPGPAPLAAPAQPLTGSQPLVSPN
jgi:hypothetical protein